MFNETDVGFSGKIVLNSAKELIDFCNGLDNHINYFGNIFIAVSLSFLCLAVIYSLLTPKIELYGISQDRISMFIDFLIYASLTMQIGYFVWFYFIK